MGKLSDEVGVDIGGYGGGGGKKLFGLFYMIINTIMIMVI